MADNNSTSATPEDGLSTSLGPRLSKGKVIIHTMPKSFINGKSKKGKGKSSKHIGLIILSSGILLMGLLFAGAYYFVINQNKSDSLIIPDVDANKNATVEDKVIQAPPAEAPLAEPEAKEPEAPDEPEGTNAEDEPPAVIVVPPGEDGGNASSAPAITEPPATSTVTAAQPVPGSDFDRDGLTDSEEILLGTNFELQDSDGDGYDDYSELLNLYNPAGNGTIIVNSKISKYTNGSYRYSLYYPNSWKQENVGGEESILFRAPNNQFIQIIVTANSGKVKIDEWYRDQVSEDPVSDEQKYYKQGWTGIRSEDGFNVYLMNPSLSHVFTVTYNTGITNKVDYRAIFEMLVKSLEMIN